MTVSQNISQRGNSPKLFRKQSTWQDFSRKFSAAFPLTKNVCETSAQRFLNIICCPKDFRTTSLLQETSRNFFATFPSSRKRRETFSQRFPLKRFLAKLRQTISQLTGNLAKHFRSLSLAPETPRNSPALFPATKMLPSGVSHNKTEYRNIQKTNMEFSIFISWQSDIKGNRNVIINSAQKEADRIKKGRGLNIKIDHSTLEEPGAPKIEDTILDKINRSDMFICDITPVTKLEDKQIPNSNVMFELGFAVHYLGWERILLVASTGDWEEKDLPFDLNHHRILKFQSKKDCDFKLAIDKLVDYCLDNPQKGFRYNPEEQKANPLTIYDQPVVFFDQRMAKAFPGKRDLFEITDKTEIFECLTQLFKAPLKFEVAKADAKVDPVWRLRGGSGMPMDTFRVLDTEHILLGWDELNVKRIVAYRDSGRYYQDYLYLETYADEPSGTEEHNPEAIKEMAELRGYYSEEYAVFKYEDKEYKISRHEYDDGAVMIEGKNILLNGHAELRVRYLTPYNCVIAAKDSPYNSREFDCQSGDLMDGLLNGDIEFTNFHEFMMSLDRKDDLY